MRSPSSQAGSGQRYDEKLRLKRKFRGLFVGKGSNVGEVLRGLRVNFSSGEIPGVARAKGREQLSRLTASDFAGPISDPAAFPSNLAPGWLPNGQKPPGGTTKLLKKCEYVQLSILLQSGFTSGQATTTLPSP